MFGSDEMCASTLKSFSAEMLTGQSSALLSRRWRELKSSARTHFLWEIQLVLCVKVRFVSIDSRSHYRLIRAITFLILGSRKRMAREAERSLTSDAPLPI